MTPAVSAKFSKLKNAEPLKGFIGKFKAAFPKGEIFLAGGIVRDIILGRDGSKDIDLVIRGAAPEELEKFLSRHGTVNLVGKNFGVWKFLQKTVEVKPRTAASPLRPEVSPLPAQAIDIALPRTEHSFNSGGYRDVSVSADPELPIEQDLARRDFTINAMAYRLYPKPELVDPYGGQKDLRAKIIRAVGNPMERFREDYTRMFRALRFAAALGFKIEEYTMAGIRNFMPRANDFRSTPEGNIRLVPNEIASRELVKGLIADPVRTFDLWDESGATEAVMPELLAMRGCPQPENFHTEGDVWAHTRLALAKIGDKGFVKRWGKEKPPAIVYLATLFHDVGKPATMQTPEEHGTDRIRYNDHDRVGAEIAETVARRLSLSSAEGYGIDIGKMAWIVRYHLFTVHGNIDQIRPGTLEKYFFNPNLPGRELLMVIYADSMATVPKGGIRPDHLKHLDRLMERISELAAMGAGRKLPPPLLNGGDIMKLTRLDPGPKVGELIAALREAQLEGKIKTKTEAKKFLKAI